MGGRLANAVGSYIGMLVRWFDTGKNHLKSSSVETLTAERDKPELEVVSGDMHLYRIRPMSEKDIDQVLEIDRRSFSLAWPPSAYRYELKQNPGSMLWVAEWNSTPQIFPTARETSPLIVGVIVLWMILDEGHIATIAVHPDYRNQGIGSQLLITALQEAIRQKAGQVTLEVRASNINAQKLYQRFHFELVGRRPRYYRDNNEDALVMTVQNINFQYEEWLDQVRYKSSGQVTTT
jgi:[ribosomal protein S18]-alanine N-acetyltransferase